MDLMEDTLKKVEDTISRYQMIKRGDGVIVAVSGGADSVCLLDVLYRLKDLLGVELVVAHFDHGLRPDEDEQETEFVRSLAGSLGCRFFTERADPSMASGAGSLEERAREARYRFLMGARNRFSAQRIAVGHNLNDQAETVLMRLLRGSGPSGLSGIPPVRDSHIIRPLIQVTRSEIESYLSLRGLAHITDPTNSETRYLRNEIRMNLLPRLEKYQSRIVQVLGRTAEIMREEASWLETEAAGWVKRCAVTASPGETTLPLDRFNLLPGPLKNHVIRHALRRGGRGLRRITMRHMDGIRGIAEGKRPQAEMTLPNGGLVKRVYGELMFSRSSLPPPEGFCHILERPGTFYLDPPGCAIQLHEYDRKRVEDLTASARTACFDADLTGWPLMLRNFRHGDRFVPLGMTGHKKLKKFFIDMKVPSHMRATIPILIRGDRPIWVCGIRMDDRFKVTSETRRVLKVTFEVRERIPLDQE
ncbi:MAG: tRNA lysidine(34) synthetase TilS [Deltaproteobacteria bacterium]|nr:tRNA lysidine(34) synthetase TilS [Deltaproteobacteria bacterium]